MAITRQKKISQSNSEPVSEFLLTHSFPPQLGGLERYWRTVIEHADRSFGVLTNQLPHGETEVSFNNLNSITRAKLWALPLVRPSWLPWWWRLPNLVTRLRPQRIHIGHYTPLADIIRKRLSQYPAFLYLHGTDVREALQTPRHKQHFIKSLQASRRVIANSNFLADHVVRETGFDRKNIRLVHPGIPVEAYKPNAALQQQFLNQHALVKGKFFITISRLIKQKGIEQSIAAFAQAAANQPEWHYCIFGEGPERQALEHQARATGVGERIHFLGSLPDDPEVKASYFSLARAAVMTTSAKTGLAESFGIVALEAQAAGIPVIISNAGGTAEAVLPDLSGFVVPADDPAALSDVLGRLMADESLARTMGVQARAHVLKNFSATEMVNQLTQIWNES